MAKGMNFKLSERDLGLKSFSNAVQKTLKNKALEVGVFAKAGSDVALRASVHEFGSASRHIPARSFIRSTLEEKKEEYRAILRNLFQGLLVESVSGTPNIKKAFGILGEKVTSDFRAKIRSGIPPKLADSTILARLNRTLGGKIGKKRRKKLEGIKAGFKSTGTLPAGTITPLIDSGRMIQAIAYRVVK